MPELKPCPFCGSHNLTQHFSPNPDNSGFGYVGVVCSQCNALTFWLVNDAENWSSDFAHRVGADLFNRRC